MDIHHQMMNNCNHSSAVPLQYPHVVLQWNCRSVIDKKSELINLINKYEPSVIALGETWLKPSSPFKIRGYTCLRQDRNDGHDGAALLVKNNLVINHIPLPDHNDFFIVAAVVINICFVSIYIPYLSSSILQELNHILHSLPKPLLLLGDFNCHHISWGSSISGRYSGELIDLLDQHSLCLLNTGIPTRRTKPHENLSAVDLSITSPTLASALSWKTLSSTFGSDHYPIIICFPGNKVKPIPPKPRMKYRLIKDNWPIFKEYIEDKCQRLPDIANNCKQECSTALCQLITEAADASFPLKNASTGRLPSLPWWDSECTEAVNKRKEAEIEYNTNMTDENFNILIDIIANTKTFLREKKFLGWRQNCTSISPKTPPSVMWTKIKRFRLGVSDSTFSTIPPSMSEEFLNHLAPPFVPEQELFQPLQSPLRNDNDFLYSPFTINELKGVLSSVRDSAPGEDGIPYSFFSNLGDNTLDYYLQLINSIIMTSDTDIPLTWKSQIVLPILKPNKNPSEPSSYRPIALSPVITKLAEHLVKNRLEWFIENKNLLSKSQFGFRKGKSTYDNIGILMSDIRLAFSKNESVVAVFLDIKSAYDNVSIKLLKRKLEVLSFPIHLTNFIIKLLSGRIIKIESHSRIIWKGLPQGSVLSPILYNIYSHDLEGSLNGSCNILQYADDVVLYCSSKYVNAASSHLSNSLTLLKIWLDQNDLELSVSKSCALLFTRNRMPPPITLYYNRELIPTKTETKFLGVILDAKLSGLSHCTHIATKCERSLNILRSLSGVWWGAHPFSLKLVYNALIRSVLDYGTFLLEPCSLAGMKKLDAIQTKALRIITGAMKNSPINALQVECVDPPLYLRRQYLADRFFSKMLQFSEHTLLSKLLLLIEQIDSSPYWKHKSLPCLIQAHNNYKTINAQTHSSRNLSLFESDYQALIISPIVHLDLGIRKGDLLANNFFNSVVDDNWQGWHQIYCDASKHSNNDCVGVGLFHKQYKIVQKVKFPPQTSIFTAECFGIYKALEYINLMKLSKTVIFSDSKSAIQALERFPFKRNAYSPIIVTCREMLLKCVNKGLSVSFAWIPSHSGIIGNEKADELANSAVQCGDLYPYKNYSEDIAALSKLYLQKSWSEVWKNGARLKGKYYYCIQPNIPVKPWFYIAKLNKRATSVLIRMRLGHMCSPAHLARIRVKDSNICECGQDVGDANHIFLNCPRYDYSLLYQSLIEFNIPLPTNILCLLSSNSISIYKVIASFIEVNDIKL